MLINYWETQRSGSQINISFQFFHGQESECCHPRVKNLQEISADFIASSHPEMSEWQGNAKVLETLTHTKLMNLVALLEEEENGLPPLPLPNLM